MVKVVSKFTNILSRKYLGKIPWKNTSRIDGNVACILGYLWSVFGRLRIYEIMFQPQSDSQ